MATDLNIRLREYFTAAEPQAAADPRPYADALSSSAASSTAASAGIIGGHTRILKPDVIPDYVPRGQNELDFLLLGKPDAHPASQADEQTPDDPAPKSKLPLPPGDNSLEHLAKGAAGIPLIKALSAPNA